MAREEEEESRRGGGGGGESAGERALTPTCDLSVKRKEAASQLRLLSDSSSSRNTRSLASTFDQQKRTSRILLSLSRVTATAAAVTTAAITAGAVTQDRHKRSLSIP